MSKIVCSTCEVEYRPYVNGVSVIEYSANGPYKLWQADEWECPNCLQRVVTGFANEPIRSHAPGFPVELADVLDHPELVRYDFESQEQRVTHGARI